MVKLKSIFERGGVSYNNAKAVINAVERKNRRL